MAMTTRDATSTVASKIFPLRRPAMRPKVTPKTVWIMRASTASMTVTGKIRPRDAAIGWPVKSTPRLKVNRFLRKSPYCTQNGWSRLYCWRSCAITASLGGRSPNSARMGSPGSAKTMK
ncbi:hypothetical protein D9M72_530090 [compost metagenome]